MTGLVGGFRADRDDAASAAALAERATGFTHKIHAGGPSPAGTTAGELATTVELHHERGRHPSRVSPLVWCSSGA